MSSDKHCCVPGCKESGGMHRVLHGFPNPERDKERFNTWLYAIGGYILNLENECKYPRVCHSHFEDKYLCRNNKISNIAVPTLNMSDKNILPAKCKETADLLLFMDKIFDSVNGSYMKYKNAKPLLGPATPNSVHHRTWLEGMKIFNSMKYYITLAGKKETVPSVTNWVWKE